jgi:hypothetical protein
MNLGALQPIRADNRGSIALSANAYFDRLKRLGYALRIYETGWVDLCAHDPHISCVRYDEAGLSALYHSGLSAADKRETIVVKFVGRSSIARRLLSAYNKWVVRPARRVGLPLRSIWLQPLTSSLQSLEVSDKLIADLAHARPGQAYIAHLLLPHVPYVTRPDCQLKARRDWRSHRIQGTMREREDAGFEQILCAARKVEAAMAAIERSPAGRNYVVIIHGDHGSRNTLVDPRANARPPSSDRDIVAAYSTIFAIKAPAVAPGYVAEPARVGDLLAAFVDAGFAAPPMPRGGDQDVFLEDAKWRPVARRRMPQNWTAIDLQ